METKIDKTKLKTVQNYAKKHNISRPTVYKRLKLNELKKEVIDGKTYVNDVF